MRSDRCFDLADRKPIEGESREGYEATGSRMGHVVWLLETATPLELTCELL